MRDLFGPDIQNSVFAHIVHVLLVGGVVAYGWQAVTALVRKPTRVGRALRKAVNVAWLSVLFMLLTQPNPVPYLRAAGVIAVLLIALAGWDRLSASGKKEGEELLTSGPAGGIGREAEMHPAAVGVRRD